MSLFHSAIAAVSSISIKATDVGLPTSTTTIAQGLTNTINLLVSIIGSLSVLMIIVGGLLYSVSSGDPARIKRARDTITYAIAGLIISIVAYAVVNFIAFALKG